MKGQMKPRGLQKIMSYLRAPVVIMMISVNHRSLSLRPKNMWHLLGRFDFDVSDMTKKPKSDQVLKPQVDEAPHEASPSSTETELIPDEDIDRACQQAEDKIREQHQPQEPVDSCASLSNASSTAESWDKFAKPKRVKSSKTTLSDKKPPKKPLIIDALLKKSAAIPGNAAPHLRTQEEPSSSTNPSSCGCNIFLSVLQLCFPSYFSSPASRNTPAIVPPKKVRKVAEPNQQQSVWD